MTLLIGTSIIVANSFTVTNSVSFSTFSCCSCSASSCSAFWRWISRFSFRYLAPLDLAFLPCSLSRVSRTCFWTSSSVGSILVIILLPFFSFLVPTAVSVRLPLAPVIAALGSSLRIRLRLRFSPSAACAPAIAASFSFLPLPPRFFLRFFSNWLKSIFSPTTLGPVSFWYWVSITPIGSNTSSSSTSLCLGVSFFFLACSATCWTSGFW